MTLTDLATAERGAYLTTLSELVKLESPTDDKAANDRVVDYLSPLLKGDGWQLERLPQAEVGDQLVARFAAPGNVKTLLLCHVDTVWPVGTLAQMPLREADGKLYGPGVMDMKAGVTSAVHALRIVGAASLTLRGPVTLLLTSDEEKGSPHSRELIERLSLEHDRVLVLEPSADSGALKVGRKGVGEVRAAFKGVSAHAGNNPQDGASALRELAHFVLFAEDLTDYRLGTTLNVTVARAGSVGNVIAEAASCTADIRILKMSEAERVETALMSYAPADPRVQVTVTGGVNRPPLEFTQKNRALFAECERAMASLGLRLEHEIVGGGSDGNFSSALGVPTLDGLGCYGVGPHARHEHILIEETLERLALLVALLTG